MSALKENNQAGGTGERQSRAFQTFEKLARGSISIGVTGDSPVPCFPSPSSGHVQNSVGSWRQLVREVGCEAISGRLPRRFGVLCLALTPLCHFLRLLSLSPFFSSLLILSSLGLLSFTWLLYWLVFFVNLMEARATRVEGASVEEIPPP